MATTRGRGVAGSVPSTRAWLLRLVWVVIAVVHLIKARVAALGTNAFLGSCLTAKWVEETARRLGVDASDRDDQHRLRHPFLQKAVPQNQLRYHIGDPRTASPKAYDPAEMEPDTTFYGANMIVAENGTILDNGMIDGSLILQFGGWGSHTLTSTVFSILAGEVLGYPIAQFWPVNYDRLAERMSSVGLGIQSPIHIDMEVWTAGLESRLALYSNESYLAGNTGYTGRSGVYVPKEFVQQGLNGSKYNPTFSADFWKDYRTNDQLIQALRVSELRSNAAFYPPTGAGICDDGEMGCLNFCAKSYACTLREEQGKECLVVVRDYCADDPGYVESMFSNNNIPAYFCYLGPDQFGNYAFSMQQQGKPVLFYHYDTNEFHYRYPGLFERVTFPYPTLDRVALSTGIFGENGYGNKSDNQVDVDFPVLYLSKYGARLLQRNPPIASLFDRFSMSRTHFDNLTYEYVKNVPADSPFLPSKYFDAACTWVKSHYELWSEWLDPLPMCTLNDIEITCESVEHVNNKAIRQQHVRFSWNEPHPSNNQTSYTCDGGFTLPEAIVSHFPCDQLKKQPKNWFLTKPTCDPSFYFATISDCDVNSKRSVTYSWYLSMGNDSRRSLECNGLLPSDDTVDCEYLPFHSAAYYVQAVFAGLWIIVLVVSLVVINRVQHEPIMRFGNTKYLMVLHVGAGLLSCFVLIQGGKATVLLCGLRPILLMIGFSCLVGPLLVKSYGTYRLSLTKPKHRAEFVPGVGKRCVSLMVGIMTIDMVLVLLWFLVDYPLPNHVNSGTPATSASSNTTNAVEPRSFSTSSCDYNLAFVEMAILFKVLMLVVTVILAVSNYSVQFDYGESFWLAVSSVSVSMVLVLILLLTLGISLPVSTSYLFANSLLLVGTLLVVAFTVGPKLVHLHAKEIPLASGHRVSVGTSAVNKLHRSLSQRHKSSSSHSSRENNGLVVRSNLQPHRSSAALKPTSITKSSTRTSTRRSSISLVHASHQEFSALEQYPTPRESTADPDDLQQSPVKSNVQSPLATTSIPSSSPSPKSPRRSSLLDHLVVRANSFKNLQKNAARRNSVGHPSTATESAFVQNNTRSFTNSVDNPSNSQTAVYAVEDVSKMTED